MATSDSGRARTFLLAVFVLSGGALVTLFILSRRSPDADRLPFVVPYGWGKVTTQLFLLSGLGLVPARNRPWVLAAGAGLLTVVLLNAALPRPFPIEGELVTATGNVTAVAMANRNLAFRIDSSPLVFRYDRWWPASATLSGLVHPGVHVKVWYNPRSRGLPRNSGVSSWATGSWCSTLSSKPSAGRTEPWAIWSSACARRLR